MSARAWIANTALAMALVLASAASHANLVAGKNYTVITPAQSTASPGKTEVIEFFSYGCPHCYELLRPLDNWVARLPANVAFKRVAVGFGRKDWESLARTFYALDSLGQVARLDTALFDAVHKERLPLFNEKAITDWVAQHGVDRAKFTAAYNSFGVNTRMGQQDRMVPEYQVSGVPMLVVDGRFVPQGRTFDEMLSVTTQLIAKAQAETPPKK